MKRRIGALLALVLLGAGWVGHKWRGPAPTDLAPRDIALAPRPPAAAGIQITVLGTSLSHEALWTAELGAGLAQCGLPAEITVIAQPGANVTWGRTQAEAVIATDPTLVLLEFAINDADLTDGVWRAVADRETRALLAEIARGAPQAAIVEMTMSPVSGLRGLIRWRLAAHYDAVIARAADSPELGSGSGRVSGRGVIDLYARWLALPRADRGLADGLHPDPRVAANVIVAPVRDYIAASYGVDCASGSS